MQTAEATARGRSRTAHAVPGAAGQARAMEYTAPVPGVATTTRVVSKKAMLGQTSTFGALLKDTLLTVLGTLAMRRSDRLRPVPLSE